MRFLVLAAFVAVPVVEIAAFIGIGGRIGLWPTIGLVVVTAFVGLTLLRIQGLAVLRRLRVSREPAVELFEGLCLLIAAVLLLVPGFVTDAAGFLLLVPRVRMALSLVFRRVRHGGGPVIEGEFEEINAPGRRRGG